MDFLAIALPALGEAFSLILTPTGIGAPVMPRLASCTMLRRRTSTGSRSSASARRFICISATNEPCGPPKPRKAPAGGLVV